MHHGERWLRDVVAHEVLLQLHGIGLMCLHRILTDHPWWWISILSKLISCNLSLQLLPLPLVSHFSLILLHEFLLINLLLPLLEIFPLVALFPVQ